jgi:putative spermidine/putrescine transport system permease protein
MTARVAVAARRREPVDRVVWLALPAVAYLVAVYGWPLLMLLARGVTGPAGLTLAPLASFFADPFHWQVIANTIKIAALVTLACLLIGYPTAFALAWSDGWSQLVLLAAIILPLSVGVVVKAFAWQIVLRRDGVVALAMVKLGIWSESIRLLFTEAGLVLGAANVFLPFMILPIYSVVKLIDPRLNEAGATLGATPFYRFRRILLPLTLPGILTGVVFVFSLSIAMYVIPSLLIGDRFQTLATLIGRSFLFMRNGQLGSTTALVLLAIAVFVVAGSSVLARRLERSQ